MERGCRGRQGPGEQVEGCKTEIAGRAVEASGVEASFVKQSKTGTREENMVRRAVHLSLGVADGRGSQYTEGEGDGSIKKSNGGMGFKIIR